MKTILIAASVVLLVFSGHTWATEYIYRNLMADTPEFKQCQPQPNATSNASKPSRLRRYEEKFCRTQGYGWHLETVKDKGQISCNECSDKGADQATYRCRMRDIVVTCRRIRPGSVGMLPGKG